MRALKSYMGFWGKLALFPKATNKFSSQIVKDETQKDFHAILCPQHKYIENYLRLRKYELFQKELNRLLNKNYYITLDYFNYIIREMVLNNQVELAHQMLFTMKKYEYLANDVTYTYLIEGYLIIRNFERAYSLMIEATLHNVILDLEIFYFLLTQAKQEHHSYTTLLYQLMKKNFNPSNSIIKKLFKLAYKFQNHDLLAKLEADMNMLEYSEQNEGNLRSERLKINEKSHKKYKNPDSERIDNHPIKLVYAQNKGSDNDESFRKNMKVLRNISNINILRNGKMIPFILPERDLQGDEELQQNSDRSENSGSESNNEYYDDDDDSDTYESSDDADNIILKDGNKDSDTEQLK